MASGYVLGVRTTVTSANAACAEIRVGALPICLMAIEIITTAATASTFGLGAPAAAGVTPTANVTLLSASDGASASTTTIATTWATGPTLPTKFIRRRALPATIGSTIVWLFDKVAPSFHHQASGLCLPANSRLVVWNLTATAASDINFTIYE